MLQMGSARMTSGRKMYKYINVKNKKKKTKKPLHHAVVTPLLFISELSQPGLELQDSQGCREMLVSEKKNPHLSVLLKLLQRSIDPQNTKS